MFVFNDTATTDIYTYCHTLFLHAALPISGPDPGRHRLPQGPGAGFGDAQAAAAVPAQRPGRARGAAAARHPCRRPAHGAAGRGAALNRAGRAARRVLPDGISARLAGFPNPGMATLIDTLDRMGRALVVGLLLLALP